MALLSGSAPNRMPGDQKKMASSLGSLVLQYDAKARITSEKARDNRRGQSHTRLITERER